MNNFLATIILLAGTLSSASDLSSVCLQYFENAEYEKAAPVCLEAANAGDATSQSMLGEMYDAGQGVEQNQKLAEKWWSAASDQDYLQAQNLLASKYYYGGDIFGPQPGWGQDYRKAYDLWKLGAYKGASTSQFMLGVLYMDGHGVERDYSEAYAWLNIALQGGYKLSTDVLIELSRKISAEEKRAGIERIDELKSEIR